MSTRNFVPETGHRNFTFTLDGVDVPAKEGQTVLEAAAEAGHYIPRLCYLKDVPPEGHCRICTVMINGRPASACNFPAAPDLVVTNDTPELNEMRKQVVEMLFVEGNHVCPACEVSGDCELQALGYRLGMTAPRYPYLNPRREVDASHPALMIDRNRCVLCGRCVRASRVLDGKAVFGFEGRGIRKTLAINAAGGLGDTDVDVNDAAVAACPVGCLLVKGGANRVPIGQRTYDAVPIGTEKE